jgi:conjugal transfer pilus assembly protein TraW
VPAGARINPLTITNLSKRLVFFDGRDSEQVAAVHRMVQHDSKKVKPILIAGSWLDLTQSWKQQVYFDQQGVLSKRFGIQAVPAVISQHGDVLLHQEIPAQELR